VTRRHTIHPFVTDHARPDAASRASVAVSVWVPGGHVPPCDHAAGVAGKVETPRPQLPLQRTSYRYE